VLVFADLDGETELEVVESEAVGIQEGRGGSADASKREETRKEKEKNEQLKLLSDLDLLSKLVRLSLDRVKTVVEHDLERSSRLRDRNVDVGDPDDCRERTAKQSQRVVFPPPFSFAPLSSKDSLLTNTFA